MSPGILSDFITMGFVERHINETGSDMEELTLFARVNKLRAENSFLIKKGGFIISEASIKLDLQ